MIVAHISKDAKHAKWAFDRMRRDNPHAEANWPNRFIKAKGITYKFIDDRRPQSVLGLNFALVVIDEMVPPEMVEAARLRIR